MPISLAICALGPLDEFSEKKTIFEKFADRAFYLPPDGILYKGVEQERYDIIRASIRSRPPCLHPAPVGKPFAVMRFKVDLIFQKKKYVQYIADLCF